MGGMRKEYARLRRRPFLMPLWLPLLAVVVLLAVAGWAVVSASTTVVLVMRHAEAGGEGADPLLSAAGEARAARLAALFAAAPGLAPDGIIVSEHRRTQETARPLATALGVPVIVVPAEEPAQTARRALKEFRGQRVLVIGHSNTVPDIVRNLSHDPVPAMAESEYGTLYVVAVPRFSRSAVARLTLP
jgi:phosphohistidine phosphatase SixA